MYCMLRATCAGRNGKWWWIFVQEEKRSQSGEDSEKSTQKKTQKKKNLTKDPSAADAASEEMVPYLNIILSLKCPLTSQSILLQKIFDDKNEKARLEEEVKLLKAQIEKSKSVSE